MSELLERIQEKFDLDQVSAAKLTRPLTIDFYNK